MVLASRGHPGLLLHRLVPARRRFVAGAAASVALTAVLSSGLLAVRSHASVSIPALVLVVPVVVGVAVGGFAVGAFATAVGFLVYDFLFIPPYYTMTVGSAQNWTALGVYAVVMVVVARVVDRVETTRAEAQTRARELRRLFDVSELLVRDTSARALLDGIVLAVRQAFELEGAALLLPGDDGLQLVASVGEPLSDAERAQLSAGARLLSLVSGPPHALRAVALVAAGRPVGLLALRGGSTGGEDLLRAFANHLALALQRSQLQEQAVRAGLLEEVDRLRTGLVGAVSHDLRTPLATIKVAASTLLDPEAPVSEEDERELLGLIDGQADRLDHLVANLLDMTRIQAGALELRRAPVAVGELLAEARSRLGGSAELERIVACIPADLPLVDVDRVLIGEALANLLDNAVRYSPSDRPVTVTAEAARFGKMLVSVSDHGPGLPAVDGSAGVLESIGRREAGGAGGLGLAIVQAFVEVHGEKVWVEPVPGGGTRVVFSLPVAG